MATPTNINLSDSAPPPPTGTSNVKWQAGTPRLDPNLPPQQVRDVSAYVPDVVGDTGSGGTSGAVPAPAAGDAAAGKFLKADGTWALPPTGGGGGGSGTVTSVGLSAPPEFTVSGSPVTASGTLALAKANETANTVWAGPLTGSPAAPTFRAIDPTDVPALPESKITGLTTDLAGKVPTTRLISTTAPLSGGGDLSADRTLAVSTLVGDSGSGGSRGVAPAPGAGDAAAGKFLKADGTWAATPGSSLTSEVPAGTMNGTNVTFTLSQAPSPAASLLLFLNGVEQRPGTDYTLSGTTITYAVAPRSADWHLASYGIGGGAGTAAAMVIGFIIGSGSPGTNVGPMLAAPRTGAVASCVVTTKASDGGTALGFTIKKNGASIFSSPPAVAAGTASGSVVTTGTLTTTPLSVSQNDVFSMDITTGTSNWQFTAQLE